MFKLCPSCNSVKKLGDFNRSSNKYHNGVQWECKECSRKRKACNRYKISLEEYEERMSKQNCDICGKPFEHTPYIDHDHDTGKARGTLCRGCNAGLGCFKDSVENLEKAIEYLNHWAALTKPNAIK